MRRLLRVVSLVAFLILFGAASARAQLSTAQLSGRVTDESSAVLPGVTVTVTQSDTGFTRSDVTDVSATIEMSSSARRLLAHLQTDMIRHRRVERFVRQAGFDLESIEPTPMASICWTASEA